MTGSWAVTTTPTRGEANYKITPYNLSNLVVNEVCPAEGWIEIYNNSGVDQRLQYSYIESSDNTRLFTAPAGLVLKDIPVKSVRAAANPDRDSYDKDEIAVVNGPKDGKGVNEDIVTIAASLVKAADEKGQFPNQTLVYRGNDQAAQQ